MPTAFLTTKPKSMFKQFDVVRVINENYSNIGIHKGDTGAVLEIYDDKCCEVEFCDENGITYALQTLYMKDLELTVL